MQNWYVPGYGRDLNGHWVPTLTYMEFTSMSDTSASHERDEIAAFALAREQVMVAGRPPVGVNVGKKTFLIRLRGDNSLEVMGCTLRCPRCERSFPHDQTCPCENGDQESPPVLLPAPHSMYQGAGVLHSHVCPRCKCGFSCLGLQKEHLYDRICPTCVQHIEQTAKKHHGIEYTDIPGGGATYHRIGGGGMAYDLELSARRALERSTANKTGDVALTVPIEKEDPEAQVPQKDRADAIQKSIEQGLRPGDTLIVGLPEGVNYRVHREVRGPCRYVVTPLEVKPVKARLKVKKSMETSISIPSEKYHCSKCGVNYEVVVKSGTTEVCLEESCRLRPLTQGLHPDTRSGELTPTRIGGLKPGEVPVINGGTGGNVAGAGGGGGNTISAEVSEGRKWDGQEEALEALRCFAGSIHSYSKAMSTAIQRMTDLAVAAQLLEGAFDWRGASLNKSPENIMSTPKPIVLNIGWKISAEGAAYLDAYLWWAENWVQGGKERTPASIELHKKVIAAYEVLGKGPGSLEVTYIEEALTEAMGNWKAPNFPSKKWPGVQTIYSDSKPLEVPMAIADPKTKTQQFIEKVSPDVYRAGVGVAARQATKLVQEPIVALLLRDLPAGKDSPEFRARVAKGLASKTGAGFLSAALGGGTMLIPGEHPFLDLVGSELRQEGVSEIANELADIIMGPLRTVITDLIKQGVVAPKALEGTNQRIKVDMDVTIHTNEEVGSRR